MARATEVHVERQGNRIVLRSGYFVGVADMCKAVPGHTPKFDKETGKFDHWSYPLSLQTCRNLRRVFTDMLVVGPKLKRYAQAEIARERSQKVLGRSRTATLRVVPDLAPEMATAIANRPYQAVGARFIAQGKRVLIADEPKLGKTIQTYAGIMEAGKWNGRHLVCAPKASLETAWFDELYQWAGSTGAEAFFMPDGREAREAELYRFHDSEAESKFLIINPEMTQTLYHHYCKKCGIWEEDVNNKLKDVDWPEEHYEEDHETKRRLRKQDWPYLFHEPWTSITVDEAHWYLLGLKGSKNTQVAEGLMRLPLEDDGLKIALTGTPLKGRALSYWCMFHWLRPTEFKSKWQFAESFLEISENRHGKKIHDVRKGREEELYALVDKLTLRRTVRECQPHLPPKTRVEHWVSMTPRQRKQYMDIEELGEAAYGDEFVNTIGVLAEYTRKKQIAFGYWRSVGGHLEPVDSPKFDLVVEMLRERGVTGDPASDFIAGPGYKFVIVSQFTHGLEWMAAKLRKMKIDVLEIHGNITGKKRANAIREFQSDGGARVLLLNTLTGGVAITLDAHCDEMFILDETWVHDDQEQVEARIDNRKHEVRTAPRFFHYIRTKETIDQLIHDSGMTQEEFQRHILDGRRGVDSSVRLLKAKPA